MAPLDHEGPAVEEFATRFLYPFLYSTGQAREVAERLLDFEAPQGARRVWKRAEPHDFYLQELLGNVSRFLFFEELSGGCQFLEVPRELLQSWFKSSGIPMSTGKGEALFSAVICDTIEVLLSPYGAGVLSIALRPLPEKGAGALSLGQVKDFNYRGAQLRDKIMPRFTIPYPETRYAEGMASAPAADAPIRKRLGATGGVFTLGELREFLLEKIPSCDKVQDQFSIYSVVRFGRDVSFDSTEAIHELAAVLAGLSQIEERLHAGAPKGEIEVPNRILNVKHWAAVSFLGATHLIADQGVPYDGQRFQSVRDKYFVPYLTALLQRLATHRIRRDAQEMVVTGDSAVHARSLTDLRFEMLRFAACSNFTEVSSREAINRYYDISREGLRVAVSLVVAKEAIVDLDAANAAMRGQEMNENLGRNVETVRRMSVELEKSSKIVAAVQSKVEWLEVFFVSFYAAELAHLVGDSAWSLLWALAGGLLALVFLRPWRHPKGGDEEKPPAVHGRLPAKYTSTERRVP